MKLQPPPINIDANMPPVEGDCYGNTFRLLAINREWTLVHGVVVGQAGIDGKVIGHAWLECEYRGVWWAYDPTFKPGDLFVADVFHGIARLKYQRRYSFEEATYEGLKSGHCGAWDKKVLRASHNNDGEPQECFPKATAAELRAFRREGMKGPAFKKMIARLIAEDGPKC